MEPTRDAFAEGAEVIIKEAERSGMLRAAEICDRLAEDEPMRRWKRVHEKSAEAIRTAAAALNAEPQTPADVERDVEATLAALEDVEAGNLVEHAEVRKHWTNEQIARWATPRLIRLSVGLLDKSIALRELAVKQAEDAGLWFVPTTAAEDYLQQALRRLHAIIETPTED